MCTRDRYTKLLAWQWYIHVHYPSQWLMPTILFLRKGGSYLQIQWAVKKQWLSPYWSCQNCLHALLKRSSYGYFSNYFPCNLWRELAFQHFLLENKQIINEFNKMFRNLKKLLLDRAEKGSRSMETWMLCVQRIRVCWFIGGPRIAFCRIELPTCASTALTISSRRYISASW